MRSSRCAGRPLDDSLIKGCTLVSASRACRHWCWHSFVCAALPPHAPSVLCVAQACIVLTPSATWHLQEALSTRVMCCDSDDEDGHGDSDDEGDCVLYGCDCCCGTGGDCMLRRCDPSGTRCRAATVRAASGAPPPAGVGDSCDFFIFTDAAWWAARCEEVSEEEQFFMPPHQVPD